MDSSSLLLSPPNSMPSSPERNNFFIKDDDDSDSDDTFNVPSAVDDGDGDDDDVVCALRCSGVVSVRSRLKVDGMERERKGYEREKKEAAAAPGKAEWRVSGHKSHTRL
jgi:hypothetical protein